MSFIWSPPTLPMWTAQIYLIPLLVLGLMAVWTDLSRMKIPNWITDCMLVAFVPLGLIALPFHEFMWQLANPAVLFAAGIVLHAARLIGAGDIKFIIAASPYVMAPDWMLIVLLLMVTLILGAALHRLARATIGPKLAPSWESWHQGKRYPMALSLVPALLTYLGLALSA